MPGSVSVAQDTSTNGDSNQAPPYPIARPIETCLPKRPLTETMPNPPSLPSKPSGALNTVGQNTSSIVIDSAPKVPPLPSTFNTFPKLHQGFQAVSASGNVQAQLPTKPTPHYVASSHGNSLTAIPRPFEDLGRLPWQLSGGIIGNATPSSSASGSPAIDQHSTPYVGISASARQSQTSTASRRKKRKLYPSNSLHNGKVLYSADTLVGSKAPVVSDTAETEGSKLHHYNTFVRRPVQRLLPSLNF